ncbi:MAG: hypothetical protein JW883_16995 [Deltaproteobacteria bacterium]|nr:hypothetical protein [Deltaproteobacteria bacterium]
MLKARPARAEDAHSLAPRLRKTDLLEIMAMTSEAPLIVLERGISMSEPCYAIVDEKHEPCAVFGVVPEPVAPRLRRSR